LKIVQKNLQQGFVKVVADTQDDLWHLYNVIYKGDEVYAMTPQSKTLRLPPPKT
jgi:protein pelota